MMFKPTERTLLATHRGCLDGTGSALMFIWAGGLRRNVIFRNPGQCSLTAAELASFDVDEVWFADLCPASLEDPAGGLPFHVFDHHLSNVQRHGDDPRCTFDMTKSGTSLLARELNVIRPADPFPRYGLAMELNVQELIDALEAYDLGRFDNREGQRLADAAGTYTQDEMLDILILNGPDTMFHRDIVSRAEAMASVRKIYAEQAARNARIEEWDAVDVGSLDCTPVRVAVAVSPVYWKNAVAMGMLARPEAPQVAVIIDPTTQMVSLRSLPGGPDCSVMAGLYGGGGHARAAGFKASGGKMLEALSRTVFG